MNKGPAARGLFHRLDRLDLRIIAWLDRHSHPLHRWSLGFLFIWFGLLKCLGQKTGSSLIAQAVYWVDPEWAVPALGVWEVTIGLSLMFKPLVRLGIFLLLVRVPGTLLPFFIHPAICFESFPFAPTVLGQLLIKDLVILFAALAIGAGVRREKI